MTTVGKLCDTTPDRDGAGAADPRPDRHRASLAGGAGPADRHRGLRDLGLGVGRGRREDREQIKAGTFPLRLKPEDWQSGSVNWLLDVIAPDRKTAGRVIANFAQVVKEGELRLHPQIGALVEKEMLEKMGASDQQKGAN